MLSNHLGNVLVTISDKKIGHTTDGTTIDYYNANVVTGNDYYPGGMQMPGRKYQQGTSSYRYGFNGKEQDKETYGDGNEYDYGFRIYNPRLGRFLSVDPLTINYPWYTPYQFAGNKPIIAIDLDGLEEKIVVNSSIRSIKPSIGTGQSINVVKSVNATAAGINFIMSKLKLKEVQQKQLVGPPPGTNGEFNSSYLTLDESNDIMKETIGQFTLQSTSVYSENKSLDLSIVTEVYNVQFDFNYSLLGDENTIASVKELVSKSMTVTEYAGDITGSKILDKVSSKGGIASGILNEDYISLFETATTTISEKLLANKNSVLTAIFKKGAPAIAEKSVGVISLALTNSAAESNTDKKDEAVKNLKTRTVAALLLFFETGNKTKTVISPAQDPNPSRSDNTHIPLVNPNQ